MINEINSTDGFKKNASKIKNVCLCCGQELRND